MTGRAVLVVAVLVGFALAKFAFDRRRAALADRSAVDHPEVPVEFRGPDGSWLVFATQFCATCGPVVERLRTRFPDGTVHKVSVEDHGDLATRFAIRTAPTLLRVDAAGRVEHSQAGADAVLAYVRDLVTTTAADASGGADLPA